MDTAHKLAKEMTHAVMYQRVLANLIKPAAIRQACQSISSTIAERQAQYYKPQP